VECKVARISRDWTRREKWEERESRDQLVLGCPALGYEALRKALITDTHTGLPRERQQPGREAKSVSPRARASQHHHACGATSNTEYGQSRSTEYLTCTIIRRTGIQVRVTVIRYVPYLRWVRQVRRTNGMYLPLYHERKTAANNTVPYSVRSTAGSTHQHSPH
jgi:hypothetical protein